MKRDGANESLWQFKTGKYPADNRKAQEQYDVIIVGGGITGATCANRLQTSGKSCLLIEAHEIGFGTTGGTTAHLNSFFDTPYNKVRKNFGKHSDQLLAQGAAEALHLIKSNVSRLKMDCAFKELPGYVFARNEKQSEELQDIAEGAQRVNVAVQSVTRVPVFNKFETAFMFPGQAQFNPIRYVYELLKNFESAGGVLMQHCWLTNYEANDNFITVTTSRGQFKCQNLVLATHVPPGVNLLNLRLVPWRSYAIACTLKRNEDYPSCVIYDMEDPYHYYRTQATEDGQLFLIAGGEDHKTGHEEKTDTCFDQLEAHIRQFFDVEKIAFKWSSQYFEPVDGLPYIGHLPGHPGKVFVATGFGGNGMIYGSLSGIIISDMIGQGKSNYEDLFNPNRIKPIAGFKSFIAEAADVAGHLLGTLLPDEKMKSTDELVVGEGRLVSFEKRKLGIYKDDTGKLYAVNPICTHLKCEVAWNATEKSWDCPCHGSRFSIEGKVLTGPATRDLEQINVES